MKVDNERASVPYVPGDMLQVLITFGPVGPHDFNMFSFRIVAL